MKIYVNYDFLFFYLILGILLHFYNTCIKKSMLINIMLSKITLI